MTETIQQKTDRRFARRCSTAPAKGNPMSKPKPGLRLVPKGAPEPGAEIAMMEFRALKAIRGLSTEERIERSVAIGRSMRRMALLAAEIIAVNKDELAAKVADASDLFGGFLTDLAQAKADAKALHDVIGAAENWLTAALVNVKGNTGEVQS
jgi:hypothetical protein